MTNVGCHFHLMITYWNISVDWFDKNNQKFIFGRERIKVPMPDAEIEEWFAFNLIAEPPQSIDFSLPLSFCIPSRLSIVVWRPSLCVVILSEFRQAFRSQQINYLREFFMCALCARHAHTHIEAVTSRKPIWMENGRELQTKKKKRKRKRMQESKRENE